jgi:hypothetical protein
MKQEKTPLSSVKRVSEPRLPAPEPWRPTWKWHLKLLAGIYLALIVVYVGVSALLSRLPPPYGLRSIPKEITPWLKK